MIRKLLFVTALTGVASTVAFAQTKTPATPAKPAQPAPQPAVQAKPAADKPVVGPTEAVLIQAKEVKWGAAPPSLPAGAEVSVLAGDPKAEGPFVMRIKFPAKYKVPPHWHPAHEHISVLEGGFWVGHGEAWDDKALKEVKVGGFTMMPPKHGHFVQTKKKTVIQLHGWGPWGITYYNPSDDPRTAAAATPATPAKPALK